jgi:penicillin amidase
LPFLKAARTAEPALVASLGLADALDRLEAWDFTNPSGVAADFRTDGGPSPAEVRASIAAAIYNTFRPRLFAATFADEKAEYGVGFADGPAILHLLEATPPPPPLGSIFDDPTTVEVESPSVVMLRALGDALTFLRAELGDDPDAWRWGALHQVEVQDLFGEFGLTFRKLGPFPRGGGNSTVDVAGTGNATEDFRFFAGPQMRFVAEVGPEGIMSECSLPGGQIDDETSPHYDDLMPTWLNNETFPYRFKVEDVVAHTEWLLVLEPEG